MTPSGLNQANRIKLASNGSIFLLPGSTAGFVGLGDIDEVPIVSFPGRDTTYDGTFDFNVNVPASGTACSLSIWDGDTDMAGDVDDANSPNAVASLPFDTSPNTLDEGANEGDPPDDPAVPIPNTTFAGTPTITITGPAASYVYSNTNPAGNQEWERNKIISLDAECPAPPGDEDQQVASLDPGNHLVEFANLDGENMIFLATEDADIVADPCALDVTKQCQVPLPPGNHCLGKLTELVFEYVGGDCSNTTNHDAETDCSGDPGDGPVSITVTKDPSKYGASPTIGIEVGDQITFAPISGDRFQGDLGFDVEGDETQSLKLHVSCSEPLSVGDIFGSLRLVSVTSTDGGTIADPEPADTCEYTPPLGPHCTDKIAALVLTYRGGDCTETTNPQGGAHVCSGDDPGPVGVALTITEDPGDFSVFHSGAGGTTVDIGDFVIISHDDPDLPNVTKFQLSDGGGNDQDQELHTSCSRPVNLGDRFGALEVTTLVLEDGTIFSTTTLANYFYSVTNNQASPVTNITLSDDVTGFIPGASGFDLDPGETKEFMDVGLLTETTTNTATAIGDFDGGICRGDASSTVTVHPPVPFFACKKPIEELTLMFDNGGIPGEIGVKAYDGNTNDPLLADLTGIEHGDIITISGITAENIEFDLLIDGIVLGHSEFHLSCSDQDMNGPEDCGKLNGDGKNDDAGLALWQFLGLVDKDETFVCPIP